MEKALTKVGSLKFGGLWISKKAKEEFSNITEDLTVSKVLFFFGFFFFGVFLVFWFMDFVMWVDIRIPF